MLKLVALGGAVGSGLAYMMSENFKPVSEVLVNMNEEQKYELFEKCKHIVNKLDWTDVALVTQLVLADAIITRTLLAKVADHLHQQLNMKISMID